MPLSVAPTRVAGRGFWGKSKHAENLRKNSGRDAKGHATGHATGHAKGHAKGQRYGALGVA